MKGVFSQDPQTKFDDMRELPNSTKLLSLQVVFFKVSIECQTITVTFALRKKNDDSRDCDSKQIPNSTNFFEAVDLSGRLRTMTKKAFLTLSF